jgi:hypothetical protein
VSWVKIWLDAGAVQGRVEFAGGWPGLPELANLAESMAVTVRQCPVCQDVPARRFLLALAEQAPTDLAAGLRELAAGWSESEQPGSD